MPAATPGDWVTLCNRPSVVNRLFRFRVLDQFVPILDRAFVFQFVDIPYAV